MHVKEFLEKSPLEKGPEYYLRTGDCYINWSMEAKFGVYVTYHRFLHNHHNSHQIAHNHHCTDTAHLD